MSRLTVLASSGSDRFASIGGSRTRLRSVLVSFGLIAAALLGMLAPAGASAAPGTPGVPQDPVPIFSEPFENGMGTGPVRLNNYVGATGQTYTAAPAWLTACNGWILEFASTAAQQPADCSTPAPLPAYDRVRQMAYALGGLQGSPTPGQNHAVTAYTQGADPGADKVQFRTVNPISLITTNRYLGFSIDAAEINCFSNHAEFKFSLLDGNTVLPAFSTPIDPCSDPGGQLISTPARGAAPALDIRAGTYFSNTGVLFAGSAVGIQMVNGQASGNGNDAAFDNIKLLDVTPQLDKSFSPSSLLPGQPTTMTFTITNTTDLAAKTGWSFTDNLPSGLVVASPSAASTNCPAGVVNATVGGTSVSGSGNLNVGQASCTVTVNVTSPNSGTFTNSASNVIPTGVNPPGDSTVTFSSVDLGVQKTASTADDPSGGGVVSPGGGITWTITVTNNGPDNSTGSALDDTLPAGVTGASTSTPGCSITGQNLHCDLGPLANGASVPVIVTADAPTPMNSCITNSVTVDGDDPDPNPNNNTDSVQTCPADPALTISKTADKAFIMTLGEQVTYTFHVENTGNVPLSAVGVTDTQTAPAGPLDGPVTCPETTLNPGDSTDCTGTYTVTQADLNNGSLQDSAFASGTPPVGPEVDSPPDDLSIPVESVHEITIVKSATSGGNPITTLTLGMVVDYSFVVTNTGNVTLTAVGVTDTQTPPSGPLDGPVTCLVTTLQPGNSTVCSGQYTVTQDDIDNGTLHDSAVANGTPPSGPSIESEPDELTLPAVVDPSLTIAKTADKASVSQVGEQITYTFHVVNTGNVSLSSISVADTQTPPAGSLDGPVTCALTTLIPGQATDCTGTYTVTLADINNGSIADSATASGTPPTGPEVESPPDDLTVPVDLEPALTIAKSADKSSVSSVGEQITYTFHVENTGNVTLTSVSVADVQTSPAGPLDGPVTCGVTTLAPGDSTDCTGTYTVTQADLNNGSVADTATASGTPPTGPAVESPPDDLTIPVDDNPSITVAKSADKTSVSSIGEQVTYTFQVENTGNVTLNSVGVNDSQTAPAGALDGPVTCLDTSLDPGDTTTCTGTYTVTGADLDHGSINDVASSFGNPPTGPTVESDPDEVTIPVDEEPSLTIVKSATNSGAPIDNLNLGMVVDYSFLVTNTGNVTLNAIEVTDTQSAPSGPLDGPVVCPQTTLAQGESTTCTGQYSVRAADIAHGSLHDVAFATGTPPEGPSVDSPPDELTLPATENPKLGILKKADKTKVTKVGEKIAYTFHVTNEGDVELTGISVDDQQQPPAQSLDGPVSCPRTELIPGESMDCTATYTVTRADLDNKSVTDTATATGIPPGGEPVTSPPSSVTVTATPPPVKPKKPKLTVRKLVNRKAVKPGGRVTFTLIVKNVGKGKATNVRLCDNLARHLSLISRGGGHLENGNLCWNLGTIKPGQTKQRRFIARIDRDAPPGKIVNVATVTAKGTKKVKTHRKVRVKRAKHHVSAGGVTG
ncbi:MAG TPA: DUF11 domain-containing protein [Solirubrobacterales bacterium]|nr:DUF11 domain-containing protein [Solirubrobacterales bacterium]